jgi:hypothetical protein
MQGEITAGRLVDAEKSRFFFLTDIMKKASAIPSIGFEDGSLSELRTYQETKRC